MTGAASLLLGMLAPDLLDETKAWIRETSREDPADAVIWTTLVAAQLFYQAEVGHNPKVRNINDALVYVSTNLSVGYCDIFAMTDRGKQIATLLMMFGPAIAAKALDAPAADQRAADFAEQEKHEALLGRLDRIAELLEKSPATS